MTTWMLVEDEPDLYDMVLMMYKMIGVEGLAFTNGEDAIDWIEAYERKEVGIVTPQLALLDIRLPDDIQGVDVGHRIRQSPNLKEIIIVLFTAYRLSPNEEREMMKTAGADLLLYKPLPKISEFKSIVNKLINKR